MKPIYDKKFAKEDKKFELNLRACKLYPNCDKRRSYSLLKENKEIKK